MIHAICPGLSGTVPDCTLSWYPRNMKLSRKFEKITSMDFLRPSEGFVINKRQIISVAYTAACR